MQQVTDDLEESSNLPLPPDIDGNHEAPEEESHDTNGNVQAEAELVSGDLEEEDRHDPPRFLSNYVEPLEPSDHEGVETFSVEYRCGGSRETFCTSWWTTLRG